MNIEHRICRGAAKKASFMKEVDNISLDSYIMKLLDERMNEIYMIDSNTNEKLTIMDYKYRSISLAAELQNLGCGKNTIVAIMSGNCLEYPIAILATILIGGIVTCYNPAYTIRELIHVIDISRPTIVFSSNENYKKLKQAQQTISSIKDIIIFDDANLSQQDGRIPFSKLVKLSSAIKYKKVINKSSDAAAILYSSGTTGLPKGVTLSHKNLVFTNKLNRDEQLLDSPGLMVILNLPMFHSFGFNVNILTLIQDQTLIVMKRFEGNLFLSLIQKYKVKFLYLIPTLIVFLLKSTAVEEYDLSSLEVIICGAAAIKPETELAIAKKFNLRSVQQGYGLTEFTMVATLKNKNSKKLGSCGSAVPETSIRVIDLDSGLPLGPGKIGEIQMRGPSMMKGYYKNDKATNEIIDADGWLHSGDIGFYDEDEEFFIVDRQKDLIKYNSFQVAPAELEALLLEHPAINDAAVVGRIDEEVGEIPTAFVVKQKGHFVTEEEIIEYIAASVSSHKRIRGGVIFVSEIPKNPSGKILRRKLRDSLKLNSKY